MKKLTLGLLALLVLVGCNAQKDETMKRFQKTSTTSGFDTTMILIGYAEDEATFNQYFDLMHQSFLSYHELFDKYHTYEGIHNIKSINDNAGVAPLVVDETIIDLLLEAKKYTEISDYFDISLGAMLRIWHDYREEGIELNSQGLPGNVPSLSLLETAMSLTGWDKIELDETNNTVFLTEKGMELDVGAIAKGYATEKVAQILEEAGMKHGIVSGGGNIRTINTKVNDEPWSIGIQEPSQALDTPSIDAFSIPYSVSVVTSGDYQRNYYGPNDVMYSHLINPRTLMPATHFRSVTLITKDSTMADALSTVLYMMDYDEGLAFINDFNALHPDDTIGAVWIVDDNSEWYQSEHFDYMMSDNLLEFSRNQEKKK